MGVKISAMEIKDNRMKKLYNLARYHKSNHEENDYEPTMDEIAKNPSKYFIVMSDNIARGLYKEIVDSGLVEFEIDGKLVELFNAPIVLKESLETIPVLKYASLIFLEYDGKKYISFSQLAEDLFDEIAIRNLDLLASLTDALESGEDVDPELIEQVKDELEFLKRRQDEIDDYKK